jgi:hypothetical protein
MVLYFQLEIEIMITFTGTFFRLLTQLELTESREIEMKVKEMEGVDNNHLIIEIN